MRILLLFLLGVTITVVSPTQSRADDLLAQPVNTVYVQEQGAEVDIYLHPLHPSVIVLDEAFRWEAANPWLALNAEGPRLIMRRASNYSATLREFLEGRVYLYIGDTTVTLRIWLVHGPTPSTDQLNIRLCSSAPTRCSELEAGEQRTTNTQRVLSAQVAHVFKRFPQDAARSCVRARYRPSDTDVLYCAADVNACRLEQARWARDRANYSFVSQCEWMLQSRATYWAGSPPL